MNNHGEFLRTVTDDDALVRAIQNDYTKADLSTQERAMLDYAVKLNDAPTRITEADVNALRQVTAP
jgi:alkylhydroperoxidase family enzyme